ncbi:hypothetical protein HPY86_06180 [candidate division WOR-3 bacterium]|nr:hypothetical protein [candidate division WOR-3 bacterium]
MLIFAALLIALVPDVQILRYTSPDSSEPTGFHEWRTTLPATPLWRSQLLNYRPGAFQERIDILVESTLVAPLYAHLETLTADLNNEGYTVATYQIQGTSCESLRSFLYQEYQEQRLTSTILIGNLPIAWFQLIDDWNSNRRRDPDEGYEEFPCDLYFMDLNGVWEDNMVRYDTFDSLIPGCDSIYDNHYGDIAPEIGVSRIYASTIGNPVPLIAAYLSRCHAYRTGNLRVVDRALVYIDDDWTEWANEWSEQVGFLYPSRVFIADSEQTRIRDYRPRIDTAAYQWLQLCAHSWPGGHAMKYNHGQSWDWFYAESIPRLNPEICFYNLFACSNARFTEPGYCGGRYVFQSASGLGAIGSTKTGSMLEFGDFYAPLGNGTTLAEAFRQWFAAQAADGFEPGEISWFYGMTLIGDGLLKPRHLVSLAEINHTLQRLNPSCATMLTRTLTLTEPAGMLLDPSGRTVARLRRGPNDLRQLPLGVYFLRTKVTLQPIVIVR